MIIIFFFYPIKLHLPKNYEPVQNEITTNEGGQSYTMTENHKFKASWSRKKDTKVIPVVPEEKKTKTVIPDTSVR